MKSLRLPLATLATAIHLLAMVATAETSIWPQWRGPNRDGRISGVAWPDKLDTKHLREVWRVELGPSYRGPRLPLSPSTSLEITQTGIGAALTRSAEATTNNMKSNNSNIP